MDKHIYSKAYSQLINLRPDLENKYVELNILISMKKTESYHQGNATFNDIEFKS